MCDQSLPHTHVVPAGLVGGTVLETVVSDADIERTIAVDDTLDTPPTQPSYSKAVMKALIVESLRKERENTASVEQGEPHRESKQKTIADFW